MVCPGRELTPRCAWEAYSDGVTIKEFYARVGVDGADSLEDVLHEHLLQCEAVPIDVWEVVGLLMRYIDGQEYLMEVSNDDLFREVRRRGYSLHSG